MLESLKNKCLDCKNCSLCETRHNVVFGVGNEKTDIMFIGEGPGEQEDLKGEPFVGKAGILLDKLLNSIHLDRHENIYIANIVKCRPPQNRDPKPEEQDMCITWLYEQIRIIEPKIIVCLGSNLNHSTVREYHSPIQTASAVTSKNLQIGRLYTLPNNQFFETHLSKENCTLIFLSTGYA